MAKYGGHEETARHAWTPLILLLALFAVLPALLALLYLNLAASAFHMLGLSPLGALLLVGASFLGSMVNIPLSRRRLAAQNPALATLPEWARAVAPMFFYYPPIVVEQVLAINVGGAIIPIAFSLYLLTLPSTPLLATVGATVIVATVAKLLARPLPGQGIGLPVFIPLLVTALTAHFLTLGLGGTLASAAPVAYISGTLGTLIGADILNLGRVRRGSLMGGDTEPLARDTPEGVVVPDSARYLVSIGGAGIFDGIFVTGILAPLLAAL